MYKLQWDHHSTLGVKGSFTKEEIFEHSLKDELEACQKFKQKQDVTRQVDWDWNSGNFNLVLFKCKIYRLGRVIEEEELGVDQNIKGPEYHVKDFSIYSVSHKNLAC